MIFNSVLFSLGDPKDNLYIQMFVIQYSSLLRTKSYNPETDEFYLTCDEDTANYIQKTFPLVRHVKCLIHPKPKSTYDGMKMKFVLPFLLKLKDEPILYCDVDIFFMRQLRVDIPEDTIAVYPEGAATDSNYCGDFQLNAPYGFTAGFFAYRFGTTVCRFFAKLLDTLDKEPKKFYTLDQPYFNKFLLLVKQIVMFESNMMSLNGNTHRDVARVMNCCGEPGDGSFHWNKMLQLFLLSLVPTTA